MSAEILEREIQLRKGGAKFNFKGRFPLMSSNLVSLMEGTSDVDVKDQIRLSKMRGSTLYLGILSWYVEFKISSPM
jgi:hypothetical protein